MQKNRNVPIFPASCLPAGQAGVLRLASCLCFCFLVTAAALGKDISFQATVSSNHIAVGQTVQLQLIFEGTQNMPALDLPAIDGFAVRYYGPSTNISMVNGKVTSSVTHVYLLEARKVGAFNIGPFQLQYQGDTYLSNILAIEVAAQPFGQLKSPAVSGDSPGDVNDNIFLIVQPAKNRAYVNEEVPLSIKLYFNGVGVKEVQYPEFDQEGFSLGQYVGPRQYRDTLGGIVYNVIDFSTSFFGLRPGEYRLGAAHLRGTLLVKKAGRRRTASGFEDLFSSDFFDDFFGRYEESALNAKSVDIPVTIIPLPETGKPDEFNGAVGDFRMDASCGPREVKAGDPITFKVAIGGKGNFSTVAPVLIPESSAFKVYAPQVKTGNDGKYFEQIIMPLREDISEVPAIKFSFFNPATEKYEILTQGPFPVKVLPGGQPEPLKIVESPAGARPFAAAEQLGKDVLFIKETIGAVYPRNSYLYTNKILRFAFFLPLCAWILTHWFYRRNLRLQTDVRYARQLRAPAKAKRALAVARAYCRERKVAEFYDAVFAALQEYLGDKFHLSSQGITVSIVQDVLRPRGVAEDCAVKVANIFQSCDRARYAASGLGAADMQATLQDLEEIIDNLQRMRQ